MTYAAGLIMLALLIVVHELGHFLVAKFFNVAVLEFAVGFGKKVWSRAYGETVYALRLIPLGGFVRMAGEDPYEVYHGDEKVRSADELAMDSDATKGALSVAAEDTKDESAGPKAKESAEFSEDRWFLRKPLPVKMAVVLAGPIANLLFAFVVSAGMIYVYGKDKIGDEPGDPVIGGLLPEFPAEKAGLKEGDRVVEVNGVPVGTWKDMAAQISQSKGQDLAMKVQRPREGTAPEELSVVLTAKQEDPEIAVLEGRERQSRFMIGIQPKFEFEPVGVIEAVSLGAQNTAAIIIITVRGVTGLIRGLISPKKIGSPIMIIQEASNSAQRGAASILKFLIFLSVSLGVLNLLPIPILDGGHLLFYIIEALSGSPVSLRAQAIANQVGMCILAALMLLAVSNDIFRLFNMG